MILPALIQLGMLGGDTPPPPIQRAFHVVPLAAILCPPQGASARVVPSAARSVPVTPPPAS